MLNRDRSLKNSRKSSWDEYFTNTDKVDKTKSGLPFSDTTGSTNYYIFNCFFVECKESGAIRIVTDNEICTLVEDTIFNRCHSNTEGGSVYYENMNGQFVQQRTCYYKSISTDMSMSFNQWISPTSSCKNYVFQISVSQCGESELKGSYTMNVIWGDACLNNINITNNIGLDHSSIFSLVNGSPAYCNFSIFKGNMQSKSNSLGFDIEHASNSLNHNVSFCNVIGNVCGTGSDQVLLYSRYTVNINNCVFLNNIADFMFWIKNEDFTLTISDSFVDLNTRKSGGNVAFVNSKEDSQPNIIPHFYTENCFIDPKDITVKVFYLSKFAKGSAPNLFS